MTKDDLETIAEGFAELLLGKSKRANPKAVDAFVLLLNEVIDLNERMTSLEATGVKYRGVWQAADEYRRGDMVTHDGSVFHCNADTRAKPGNGSTTWSLAVKHGRDAERKRNPTGIRR